MAEGVTGSVENKYQNLSKRYFDLKKIIKDNMEELKLIHEELIKLDKSTANTYRSNNPYSSSSLSLDDNLNYFDL